MAGVVVTAPLALLVALGVLLRVVTVRRRRIAADPDTHPGLVRLTQRTPRARVAGLVVGALAGLALAAFGGHNGLGVVLAPLLFAVCIGLALLVGEVVVWREARTQGVAALETRRGGSLLPWALTGATVAALATLALLLGWAWRHQDDNRASLSFGRGYLRTFPDGFSVRTPFPGQYYSLPLIALLIGLLLVCLVALLVVVLRPRNGADPAVVTVDDTVRRRNAESVVATMLLGGAGAVAPVAVMMAVAVGEQSRAAAVGLLIVGAVAILAGGWAGAVLLVPGGGRSQR